MLNVPSAIQRWRLRHSNQISKCREHRGNISTRARCDARRNRLRSCGLSSSLITVAGSLIVRDEFPVSCLGNFAREAAEFYAFWETALDRGNPRRAPFPVNSLQSREFMAETRSLGTMWRTRHPAGKWQGDQPEYVCRMGEIWIPRNATARAGSAFPLPANSLGLRRDTVSRSFSGIFRPPVHGSMLRCRGRART